MFEHRLSLTSMRTITRLAVAVLAVSLFALPGTLAPTAQAQDLDDLEAEALEITNKLEDLEIQSSQANETYAVAVAGLEEIQARIIDREARIAEMDERVTEAEDEVAEYAVRAYVGEASPMYAALEDDLTEVGARKTYLQSASSDRQAAIDALAAAQQDLADEVGSLREDEAASQDLRDEASDAKADIESKIAEQEALLDDVDDQIQVLLLAEHDRRAQETQARAEAQAQAETGGQAPSAAAPSGAPPAVPSSVAGADAAIAVAWQLIGIPYVYGGSSPAEGFDCSGFTSYVWAQAGRTLPRTAEAQAAYTIPVSIAELQPGDLVFYGYGYIHHVALYIGNGQIIQAPGSGRSVELNSLYYWDQMHGAGRLP